MELLPELPREYNAVEVHRILNDIIQRGFTLATLNVSTLPSYANNAAAVAGGLVVGNFYRNNADPDMVCIVH